MTTLKVIENVQTPIKPVSLMYGDFIYVTGIESDVHPGYWNPSGELFVIAQTGNGKMCLFNVSDRSEFSVLEMFNRIDEPVLIENWTKLDTETIRQYLPWPVDSVTKVAAEVTITITK